MKTYIIGAGGVGSWLAEAMCRLEDPKEVVIVDGDTLEKGNLDRQLYTEGEIGRNKADALAKRMHCQSVAAWYSPHANEHYRFDWLLCCADNNPCRLDVLRACDLFGCRAIIAANETHSSEAYVYLPEWQGNAERDPRVYYPDMLTNKAGDRRSAAIGCTGEAQRENRQLVTANLMAASLAAHLYVVWAIEQYKLKPETRAFLPHRLHQNLTRNGFVLCGEEKGNK